MEGKKITISDLIKKKQNKEKITMLTAYDYRMAKLVDEVGIDVVLVGDSLGNVLLGYDSTVPVTMTEMLHHTKAVRRGVKNAFLVGDMPFMSYQVSNEQAVENAGRFMKEAGAEAVKVEGAGVIVERVEKIVSAGISVVGHLGLTPQTISKLGGYKVQGKDLETAQEIFNSALALEKAGCFLLVLECVPAALAKIITQNLNIPTIGIGAGLECDGQVLVSHDLLGIVEDFKPKFAKRYANIASSMRDAFTAFKNEVKTSAFPALEHSFSMDEELIKKLKVKK
ncbi:MAG: 3-methyl-2-oxobutanoate hydroxymethyltransferase [Candidatus Omnitrophota bacterium]